MHTILVVWPTSKSHFSKMGIVICIIQSMHVPTNACSHVIAPELSSAAAAQTPPLLVNTSDTQSQPPPLPVIASDSQSVSAVGSEKESTIGALGEESLSELMEALPDPENVFSDAV